MYLTIDMKHALNHISARKCYSCLEISLPFHLHDGLFETSNESGDSVWCSSVESSLRMKTVELGQKTPQPFSTFIFEIRKRKRTSRT